MTKKRILITLALGTVSVISLVSAPDIRSAFTARDKAYYAGDPELNFVRPGLQFKITGATIAADGTMTATVSVSDPRGLALDRLGVSTPGVVSMSFIMAAIPRGQSQYIPYTTRRVTSTITNVSATQGSSDTGGTFTQISDGVYRYTFGTKAPSGFDAAATHTVSVYGNRNLTEFELGTNYATTVFHFVPNGSAQPAARDIVRNEKCNACHDQIAAHGGSRRGVENCILCHNPTTIDPDSGNTVDFPVLVHKIHAGSSLPSVRAGTPYKIIGNANRETDFSTVAYPADVRRCETCHEGKNTHLTAPSRVACGSCHDDVNFATGQGHAAGPQFDDRTCSTCHTPKGERDFDASIAGAHVVPTQSEMLSGLNVEILKVENGTAGSAPSVSFTVKDKEGNGVALNRLGALSFTMAGPTTDYGYTSFGTDVTTPGYVTESALTAANCSASGECLYNFTHKIPAAAKGTFAIGIESRRTEVLLPGTTQQVSVQYGAKNKVSYFSVDGSPVQKRRDIVATANCNQCHAALSLHGTLRNQTEYCVLCHNPSQTDSSRRPAASNPPQGVNFNLLVHRIHTGEKLTEEGRPYIVYGFGASVNDFSEVRYPAMAPNGSTGNTANCSNCHINGSEQALPTGKNPVVDPQGPINPVQPVTSACTGCHVSISAASHALVNTTAIGESCNTCHGPGAAFAVSKAHAQ